MRKIISSTVLAIGLSLATSSLGLAYTISFESTIKNEAPGYSGSTLTSPEAWSIVWDFNSGNLTTNRPSAFTSYEAATAAVVTGSSSGQYAAPSTTDVTPYLAVPAPATPNDGNPNNDAASGYITFWLSSNTNTYLGLYWGSIDTYNSITFRKNGVDFLTLSGNNIVGQDANGNQVNRPSNPYVNIYGLDPFDSFTLRSTSRAFELDNLAVGTEPVPEPATMMLMGLGLAGLAAMGRKK
jgi:hypothetical protein